MFRPVATKPNPERLMVLAMRTLEDALAQAMHGPVPRTWGHRLALAWLANARIALAWQTRTFWQAMADPFTSSNGASAEYMRATAMIACLRSWYDGLGWPEPDPVQRDRWARAYVHRLPRDRIEREIRADDKARDGE
jgi:hypothetical protein